MSGCPLVQHHDTLDNSLGVTHVHIHDISHSEPDLLQVVPFRSGDTSYYKNGDSLF